MLAAVGFITIIVMVVLMIRGKIALPAILVILPILACFICGFGMKDIAKFIGSGLTSVLNTAALFTFSVIFFNVLGDVGMFDVIISKVVKLMGNKIELVLLLTCFITTISHLDGSGATTMLITIPTMLPLFKKMKLKPTLLLLLVGLDSGIVNMLPWSSAVMRLCAATSIDPYQTWYTILPVQIIGLVLLWILCFPLGKYLKKKGYGMTDEEFAEMKAGMMKPAEIKISHGLLTFDMLFTLALIVVMLLGYLSANVAFMIGLAIVLITNFWNRPKDQVAEIKKHGGNALYMVMIIFTIGVLVGVMNGTKMMEAMTQTLLGIMPQSVGKHLPFINGLISVPLSMCVGSDTVYMVMAPILGQMTVAYGGTMTQSGLGLMIGSCIAANLALIGPTPYLALGLAGVEMKDHLKANFLPTWAMGVVLAVIAAIIGVYPF